MITYGEFLDTMYDIDNEATGSIEAVVDTVEATGGEVDDRHMELLRQQTLAALNTKNLLKKFDDEILSAMQLILEYGQGVVPDRIFNMRVEEHIAEFEE